MVDDNKDVVTEVKKYFSSKNVGVEIAGSCSNGEDALIELKKNNSYPFQKEIVEKFYQKFLEIKEK